LNLCAEVKQPVHFTHLTIAQILQYTSTVIIYQSSKFCETTQTVPHSLCSDLRCSVSSLAQTPHLLGLPTLPILLHVSFGRAVKNRC